MKNKDIGFYALIGSIILLIFVVGHFINEEFIEDKTINFGGVEIESEQLADLTEPLGEGNFIICNINTNKCAISKKFNIEE